MDTKSTKPKPEPRDCECGCGEMTTGTRFRQGHDARLKSALIKSALSGSKRAVQKLETLGWTKFLEAKRAVFPEAQKPEKQKRTRRTPKRLDVSSEPQEHMPAIEPFRVVTLDAEGLLPETVSDEERA